MDIKPERPFLMSPRADTSSFVQCDAEVFDYKCRVYTKVFGNSYIALLFGEGDTVRPAIIYHLGA